MRTKQQSTTILAAMHLQAIAANEMVMLDGPVARGFPLK
jgi:hypothetical protein